MGRGAQRFAFACSSTSQGPSRSSSEHSPPPRSLYGLLRLYRSGAGLCPLRLLLDRLRRFSRLSKSEQLPAQIVALTFGIFPPAPLFCQFLPQRRLGLFRDLQA